ncbi:calmodulin-binding protein [Hahella sp. CCB-MM4]|uniref:BP74-related protein n=1 Tax=Hahella sp. (strain CCB-MM4) TaxID=1926491 RepID=UPI001AEFB1F4|nr:calmodulin-binding protein [Hahella sp. CCB-MM4]
MSLKSYLLQAIAVPATLFATSALAEVAYFEFTDTDAEHTFVIQLTDKAKIQQARDILENGQTDFYHVMGYITPSQTPYNASWQYHLDTDTISFFEFAIEVCDASMEYVQLHLDEVGGAFLPGNMWCPWSSKLVKEIQYPSQQQM